MMIKEKISDLFYLNSESKFGKVKNQFLAVICANFICISHGSLVGWTSPSLLILTSDETPLNNGPLSTEQASWLGGIGNISAFFGALLYLQIMKRFGRRFVFRMLAVPNLIFWVTVLISRDVAYIYAARFLAGTSGGGIFVCLPLFVSEIADNNVRGTLGSFLILSVNIGVLLMFVTGYTMSYFTLPYVMLIFPILFMIAFIFLPESPQFLMSLGKIEEAKRSIRFYKNCNDNTKESRDRLDKELDIVKTTDTNNKLNGENVKLKDFYTPEARRSLAIGVSLIIINVFCGQPVLVVYAASIFKSSGSSIDPNISSIIMIVIQIISTSISSTLVDNVGRRILFLLSSVGTGVGFAGMGAYLFLETIGVNMAGFDWIPVTSLSLAVFMAYIGLAPLVFVILLEILPSKIRADGSTYCLACINLFMFFLLKYYPIIEETIQLYACMWIFSGVCVVGVFFGIFVLEETKGKVLN